MFGEGWRCVWVGASTVFTLGGPDWIESSWGVVVVAAAAAGGALLVFGARFVEVPLGAPPISPLPNTSAASIDEDALNVDCTAGIIGGATLLATADAAGVDRCAGCVPPKAANTSAEALLEADDDNELILAAGAMAG